MVVEPVSLLWEEGGGQDTLSSHPCLLDAERTDINATSHLALGHSNLVPKKTPGLAGACHPRTLSSIKSHLPMSIKGHKRPKRKGNLGEPLR